MGNFVVFAIFLSHYLSVANALICYYDQYFDFEEPKGVLEECKLGYVCVRYVEIKYGEKRKDTMQCDCPGNCRRRGTEKQKRHPDIEFYCLACNKDGCIPESPTDEPKRRPTKAPEPTDKPKREADRGKAMILRVFSKPIYLILIFLVVSIK